MYRQWNSHWYAWMGYHLLVDQHVLFILIPTLNVERTIWPTFVHYHRWVFVTQFHCADDKLFISRTVFFEKCKSERCQFHLICNLNSVNNKKMNIFRILYKLLCAYAWVRLTEIVILSEFKDNPWHTYFNNQCYFTLWMSCLCFSYKLYSIIKHDMLLNCCVLHKIWIINYLNTQYIYLQ